MAAEVDLRGIVQQRQRKALRIVRDVYNGTIRLREQAETYLPMLALEAPEMYQHRLQRAVLFNAFRRTIEGLTGLIARKKVSVSEQLSDELTTYLQSVTLRGYGIDAVLAELLIGVLRDGYSILFVDAPEAEAMPKTMLEAMAGPRSTPYWQVIRASNIIAGHVTYRWGYEHLLHLRIEVNNTITSDRWDQKLERQIWVYDQETPYSPVTYEKWIQVEGRDPGLSSRWQQFENGVLEAAPRIPAVVAYARQPDGWGDCAPPLLDLALENLRHYELRSDRDQHLKVASVPIPVFIGGGALKDFQEIAVSASSAIALPDTMDVKLLEPTGAALSSSRQELLDVQQRMAALGLAMLQRESRAAETAEARRIDETQSSAALTQIATGCELALNTALALSAEWMDMDASAIPARALAVNDDFGTYVIDSNMANVLVNMVSKGQLSLDTLWAALERGEIFAPGFDRVAEREQIEAEEELSVTLPPPMPFGNEDDDKSDDDEDKSDNPFDKDDE